MNTQAGFSLIEMLLALAVIGLLAGLSVPLYQSFDTRNELAITQNMAAQTLREARLRARAADGDSQWGVKIASSSVTLFRGSDYQTRDSSYDLTFSLENITGVSGRTEFVFSKLSGRPESAGTVTLSAADDSQRSVSVNAVGTISF